ncbi:MAG: cation:proton antiporter, partial [Paraclostridium sp.]
GASADDTVAITLFTTFLTIYTQSSIGKSVSIFNMLISIPLTIIISIIVGWILVKLIKIIIVKLTNDYIKVSIVFSICLCIRLLESKGHIPMFNSLLTIMVCGFFIRNELEENAKIILEYMNRFWKYGKIYLFTFVGMSINPSLVGTYFKVGVVILAISLTIRSIGVLISLIGTNLTTKEKLFCVIAYLPKATVQSAKAGIPLQMGVAGGEVMQALAILSVLITAPIGAIGIQTTCETLLNKE